MNKPTIMLLCAIITFVCSYDYCMAQEFNINNAIETSEFGDNLIQTIKGKLIYTEDAPDTLSAYFAYMKEEAEKYNNEHSGMSMKVDYSQIKHDISYVYDRATGMQKFSLENNTENPSYTKMIKSFDGEKTTMLTYQVRQGLISPQAGVAYESFESPHFTPFYFGYYLYREDVSQILKTKSLEYGKNHFTNIGYVDSEDLEGIVCDVFAGADEADNASIRIWLANDYYYRPVRIVLEKEGFGGLETFITYTKFDGIYLPDVVNQKRYLLVNEEKEYSHNLTLDYVLEETSINKPIYRDDYVVDIPDGLDVHGK